MIRALTFRIASVVAALVISVSISSMSVSATEGNGWRDCAIAIGKKMPVIAVHGLLGGGDGSADWVKMREALEGHPGICAEWFDYQSKNTRWVTDSQIAPALARRIRKLAKASRANKGDGKVVVVAHSMGGLAVRQAASLDPDKSGRKIAGDLGLVVTIGTPNQGSLWANGVSAVLRAACIPEVMTSLGSRSFDDCALVNQLSAFKGLQAGSKELVNLPWLPREVPLFSIAGNVHLVSGVQIFDVKLGAVDLLGDAIVLKKSALAASSLLASGGGTAAVECDAPGLSYAGSPIFYPLLVQSITSAPCWHGALPNNKKVRELTLAAIRKYRASLAPKPSSPVCDKSLVLKLQSYAPPVKVSTLICREGYGYVLFTGPKVSVHGTHSSIIKWDDGRWKIIADGMTSHDALSASGLRVSGLDPIRFNKLFPEAQIFFDE